MKKSLYNIILAYKVTSLLRQAEEDKNPRVSVRERSKNGAASSLPITTQLRHQIKPAPDRQNPRFVSSSTSNLSAEIDICILRSVRCKMYLYLDLQVVN